MVLWFNLLCLCVMLIKSPDSFYALTNNLYYINIYHKSGVLLYSYKFEKPVNKTDSAIWGNILIGLNHILGEFIDKKDKIDVLETKNFEIAVNYNNDYGFAVLAITNRNNKILKRMMERFMNEFIVKYENELNEIQDLNKLINMADFLETEEMVKRNFKIYL
ncbi:MAG: hypothetical protein GF383_02740 [Candidatus Lokiarchaeota archaeon]|nr:hypothetical protein [Candidatus Lokiarchaeota archaeon]MBD3338393.1 hypothetical protein [Candidatus Lokiarchaeota archaeon]